MKKLAISIVSACVLLTASSAAFASAAPVDTKHHAKHVTKKTHKMHAKAKAHGKKLHAKSMKAKAVKMPKTGFGGASEQTE
ncbi:hypothetical protein [Paenibacillus sp. GCM10027626]|uniref:hypothetical protein n=1 Tax=Paenibacillus sp. GCM10027626 TaxID=3273411 RepID=UPI00364511CE